MDLIDCRLDAQSVAEENPVEWKRLASDIAKTLEQDEFVIDPRRGDIEQARQLAKGIILSPQNRISYAKSIVALLSDVIAARSKDVQVVSML